MTRAIARVESLVDKHNLHDVIQEKVVQLMMLDCKRAVPLYIQIRELTHVHLKL
jgi:vacuolar protein sorting-associated protein 41